MTTSPAPGAARFALRRDRVRIAVWIVAIVLLVVVTASSTKGLYPTQAVARRARPLASQGNPAAIAFNGPPMALDTRSADRSPSSPALRPGDGRA